ncbi:hypothetical protein OS493_032792 [Desmophyllum pertusum]|uniref:Uncharacterized protein n=1 Tax=Desmophyllum pertusum TaxID=174260 RepID=A0A9X0CUQ7_9CNID|nr:hypothetical protein OS493_032792 [Desmophyllum pertusum]
MSRSACYVYNGVVCCSSECPALEHISKRIRGNLISCSSGRQLVSALVQCKLSDCLKDVSIQNCTSEVTCQDEESNQYFEGATWSVGDCLQCSCYNGSINCTRELYVLNVDEKTGH